MSASRKDLIVPDPDELSAIEIVVKHRARSLLGGDHSSRFIDARGYDFEGTKEFEPGDPKGEIDWVESLLSGMDPLFVNEFREERVIDVILCCDASLSTRCGVGTQLIATSIARAAATIAFSAALIQDRVGLVTFGADDNVHEFPRSGKNYALYLLERYAQITEPSSAVLRDVERVVSSVARGVSLVVVISDFLFEDAEALVGRLARAVGGPHEIVAVMVDCDFAFEASIASAEWIRVVDVEQPGKERMESRAEVRRLRDYVEEHQERVVYAAQRMGVPLVKVQGSPESQYVALADFFLAQRLKR